MNSAYSYKYASLPSDYYDYSYDAGTLTDIPSKNMYKKRNNMFTRISVGSSDDYDRDYSHHVGSGYGHHVGCYEEGVSIGLLLTTFLGIAIMGNTLYTKIKANGGRRKIVIWLYTCAHCGMKSQFCGNYPANMSGHIVDIDGMSVPII